jgi:hypothetical protein
MKDEISEDKPMNFNLFRAPTLSALAALCTAAGAADAAEPSNWQSFVSVTPVYQGNGSLDSGGHFSMSGTVVRGGTSYNLGGGNRAGVSLNYDYYDYSFSNTSPFGTTAPWGTMQRYGVTVPLSFAVGDGWNIGFAPSADWFKENGANTGDSLVWGATLSGAKRFEDGNRLGLGVGFFSQIEKTSAFPFVIVDWRINDRWRLTNPLPTAPESYLRLGVQRP